MKVRKLIDYEKVVAYLEERRAYYSMLQERQLEDVNVTVNEYADTIARWSVYNDLIHELSKVPF